MFNFGFFTRQKRSQRTRNISTVRKFSDADPKVLRRKRIFILIWTEYLLILADRPLHKAQKTFGFKHFRTNQMTSSSSASSFSGGSWPGLAPVPQQSTSSTAATAVVAASDVASTINWKNKPHIEYPDWKLILNKGDSGEYDSATHVLNLTLDEASKIVDTAVKTRCKLGDDSKWAASLTESLTSQLHKIVKGEIIYCGGRFTFKDTMSSAILTYLVAMRKFVFEAS